MRRRAFIRDTLSAAGLVIAPGVIDSATRLDPVDTSPASRARKVAEFEARVHARALDFPTVPTVDQLPALVRDYVAAQHAARRHPPPSHLLLDGLPRGVRRGEPEQLAGLRHGDALVWRGSRPRRSRR